MVDRGRFFEGLFILATADFWYANPRTEMELSRYEFRRTESIPLSGSKGMPVSSGLSRRERRFDERGILQVVEKLGRPRRTRPRYRPSITESLAEFLNFGF